MMQSTVSERMECTCSLITGGCDRWSRRNGKAEKAGKLNGPKKSRNGTFGSIIESQARVNENVLAQLNRLEKPQTVLLGCDLFCLGVDLVLIRRVLLAMGKMSQHVFQIVTNNSTRLMLVDPHLRWWPNIEVGVKVECRDDTYRIYQLRKSSAHVKFVSLEPRESVGKLDLTGINRVIVAGNTRPGARPLNPDWVREIREQCIAQDVESVLKQSDGRSQTADLRLLDDRASDEMPEPPTAHDLELLAAAESIPVVPPPAPLADLPEQTLPARIWAFLRSCPGFAVALIALMALLMLVEGLWIDPVPLAFLLKETTVMVIMATFFTLVIHYITWRP